MLLLNQGVIFFMKDIPEVTIMKSLSKTLSFPFCIVLLSSASDCC